MEPQTMGARLRAARTLRGLTQEALASAIKTSTFSVSKYERGELTNPQTDTLCGIARVLGVSLDWLVLGEGNGPSKAAA
jgi:transcriptional regulator with XRE-family HTH domain